MKKESIETYAIIALMESCGTILSEKGIEHCIDEILRIGPNKDSQIKFIQQIKGCQHYYDNPVLAQKALNYYNNQIEEEKLLDLFYSTTNVQTFSELCEQELSQTRIIPEQSYKYPTPAEIILTTREHQELLAANGHQPVEYSIE
jgi:hypothetical protein